MSYISNYDIFNTTSKYYFSVYFSILQQKQYNEEFIYSFLIFLMFIIKKHYFEREYVIESKCSFFESIEWYLKEKM